MAKSNEVVESAGVPAEVEISLIDVANSFQPRESMSTAFIDDWAEEITKKVEFPPVDLFPEEDKDGVVTYYVGDGNHRIKAHIKAGKDKINAILHEGGKRASILFATSANSKHGIPRTRKDVRRCVLFLLADPTWSKRSARWIAEKAGTSHTLVNAIIKESEDVAPRSTVETQDGKSVDVSNRKGTKKAKKEVKETSVDNQDEDSVSDIFEEADKAAAAEAANAETIDLPLSDKTNLFRILIACKTAASGAKSFDIIKDAANSFIGALNNALAGEWVEEIDHKTRKALVDKTEETIIPWAMGEGNIRFSSYSKSDTPAKKKTTQQKQSKE